MWNGTIIDGPRLCFRSDCHQNWRINNLKVRNSRRMSWLMLPAGIAVVLLSGCMASDKPADVTVVNPPGKSTETVVVPTSSPGPSGPSGATGATGATGQSGATGQTGTPGANGATGTDGATGQKGAPGAPGATGSPGGK